LPSGLGQVMLKRLVNLLKVRMIVWVVYYRFVVPLKFMLE
jgi:hypothetical protein